MVVKTVNSLATNLLDGSEMEGRIFVNRSSSCDCVLECFSKSQLIGGDALSLLWQVPKENSGATCYNL